MLVQAGFHHERFSIIGHLPKIYSLPFAEINLHSSTNTALFSMNSINRQTCSAHQQVFWGIFKGRGRGRIIFPSLKMDRVICVELILYIQFLDSIIINTPMMKSTLLVVLLAVALCRNYPLFKQCDSRWGNEQLGTSSNTICKAGCAMSSVAMGVAGIGKNYNPGTLNTWLKGHGGYVSGDLIVWGSVSPLGLSYKGKVANSAIKSNLDAGHVVICNVHNGGHWVLAHGYSGNNILVNDPGYSTTSYDINSIVNNENVVYAVVGSPEEIENTNMDHQAPLFETINA